MDIHKPKSWHGGRELAKEVGTIVIGVLIALGAEQAVELLHRQTEVREAREALRSEIADDMTTALASAEEDRCLAKRLDQLTAWSRGGAHATPFTGVRFANLDSLAWETAKTGAAPHMPLAERLAYARFYSAVENQKWAIDNERGAFLKLAGFYVFPTLTTLEARQLAQDVVQARVVRGVRTTNNLSLVEAGQAMGVRPNPYSPSTRAALAALCGA